MSLSPIFEANFRARHNLICTLTSISSVLHLFFIQNYSLRCPGKQLHTLRFSDYDGNQYVLTGGSHKGLPTSVWPPPLTIPGSARPGLNGDNYSDVRVASPRTMP
jgi:hypothetical protein